MLTHEYRGLDAYIDACYNAILYVYITERCFEIIKYDFRKCLTL